MPLLSRSWAWPSKANSSLHTLPSVHPPGLLSWTPLAPLSSLALLWFICQFYLHHFLKLFGWLGTLCHIFTSKLCFPPIMLSPTCAQEGYLFFTARAQHRLVTQDILNVFVGWLTDCFQLPWLPRSLSASRLTYTLLLSKTSSLPHRFASYVFLESHLNQSPRYPSSERGIQTSTSQLDDGHWTEHPIVL